MNAAIQRRLRVLIIEDSDDDAELLEMELKSAGFRPEVVRTESLDEVRQYLSRDVWDIIITDYRLPKFTALAALEALAESGLDTPLIIVSGSVGEQTAVEAMKAGARDFFLKDKLTRLGLAIEREVREAAIRRERRDAISLLDALYEQSSIGLAFYDREFRYIRLNASLAAMHNLPLEAHIGRTVREIIPQFADTIEAVFRKILETGEPAVNVEISGEMPAAPGELRHWLANYYPIREKNGAILGIGAIVAETTTLKRTEQERDQLLTELRQAVRARDEFLSIASHELKTPITALQLQIASSFRALRNETGPMKDALSTKLEGASRQVGRLTVLVNNLLEVTRITNGQRAIARSEVNLSEVVRANIEALSEVIKRSHSEVMVHADTPVVGRWDPAGVESIVGNLLTNAIKYGEGKPIEVTVEMQDTTARILVKDHGVGISEVDHHRLFERFERAVPAEHYGGFGLGLWITRNIVEAHGGVIRVASQKGVGSTFTVELPLGVEAS